VSFVDYRKYFSEMRGGAFRGIKILSAPVKPKIDIRLSEDNQRDINEIVDKTDKLIHSSLALFGQKDGRKARLINHIAYETKRSLCFISCDEFVGHYIGETEKNISALFARAESEAWIFYLHNADVLFANSLGEDSDDTASKNKPTSERALKANKEFSVDRHYLLGRIAQYPSAVVLSLSSEAVLKQVKHRADYLILT
jgi:SpoVK/Ycf46/Vps4 family AAA+-type ATPase